ncbi:MAG TPA: SCO family protein [Vicinamibacterales bacterium]|nr:SCO family protein [Vicinamibacterales bacterium]
MKFKNFRAAAIVMSIGLMSVVVSAQGNAPSVRPDPALPSNQVPDALSKVSFEQRLNEQLPLDLPFKDESGRAVKLGEYFGRKPVVLTFVYYECPMLCTQVLNGLESSLRVLTESIGKEFDVVTVSFDPKETPVLALAKKKAYLERYKRPEAEQGWHFLTGEQASIDALTKAAGFNYSWDEATHQFAHASGIVVTTPTGKVSRYFFGIDYAPRDVKFALIESSNEKIGTLAERLLLYCFHYDPAKGGYGFVAMRAVRIGGALTIVALVGFVFVSLRRDANGSDFAKASSRQAD